MGVRYVRRNFEQLTRAQPCIFLVNHQSLIDVFMVGNLVPDRTVSVGKKSLLWMPLFGWIFWLSGNLFIDRSNRERAMATMKKAEDLIKEKGLSVLIAPEGTRSKTLGVFKKGAFHLAQATGLNLQPIAISSFDQGLNYWHWNAGSVIVEVLKPISVKGKTIEALMEESHEMIRVALERINKEIAPAYS